MSLIEPSKTGKWNIKAMQTLTELKVSETLIAHNFTIFFFEIVYIPQRTYYRKSTDILNPRKVAMERN